MILIVTNRQDQTADFLILELKRRNSEYIRFNTEDFPKNVNITWKLDELGIDGHFTFHDRIVRFKDISSVWYRRPINPTPQKKFDRDTNNFVTIESLSSLEGTWKTLNCFWVSYPDNIRIAENKLFQLKQALIAGFLVPQTIVTNDPAESIAFYDKHYKDIVYKPLRKSRLRNGENYKIIFTNPIDKKSACQFDRVKYAPSLFQNYVNKRIELRITVIGEKVFAISLDSQKLTKGIHDWRKALNDGLEHKPFILPKDVSNKCKILVKNLGLEFGAIDMIITPNDQFVFLEINPNGQWAWIQQLCPELPMREALADILINGKNKK